MPRLIEENQRLSQSVLWQLQRRFFSDEGVNAWRNQIVPEYITSNPHIAHAYARVMMGWLRDIADNVDDTQPVYIVELGAGSGRLAYHIVVQLWELWQSSPLSHVRWVYVLTDFSAETLRFWQSQSQWQQWVASGVVDFALFDAESDTQLALTDSGVILSAETLKNPMAFVANYFFDGLRQDVFYVEQGHLSEALVQLTTYDQQVPLDDPAILDVLKIDFKTRLVSPAYYTDDAYNALLREYQTTLDWSYVVFPVGSLDCLGRLLAMTNGRMMMITGDKGYHLADDVEGRGEPTIKMHGSFSMMVNYHAIGGFVRGRGGQFIATDHHHASLDVCTLLFGADSATYYDTRYAYQREIVQASPDDWYTVNGALEVIPYLFEGEQLIAYLRLCQWDSKLVMENLPALMDGAGDVSERTRFAMRDAMMRTRQRYYDIGEEDDVLGALGDVLYELDFPEEAIALYQQTLTLRGEHARILTAIAQCHFELDELDNALSFVNRALALDAKFEAGVALKHRIVRALDE